MLEQIGRHLETYPKSSKLSLIAAYSSEEDHPIFVIGPAGVLRRNGLLYHR